MRNEKNMLNIFAEALLLVARMQATAGAWTPHAGARNTDRSPVAAR